MRKLVVAGLGLFFVLGCAGISDMIEQAADVEVNVSEGEDAVHPADFPFDPPEGGEIVQATDMSMAGMNTRVVMYTLPGDADTAALLDQYEAAIRDMGLEPDRSEMKVAAQSDDNSMVGAELSNSDEGFVLTLTEVEVDFGEGGGEGEGEGEGEP